MLQDDIDQIQSALKPSIRDMLRSDVQIAHSVAKVQAQEYGPLELARHTVPYIRNGQVEVQSRVSALLHPDATPMLIPNLTGSYTYYAVSVENVIFMFNSTQGPLKLPRKSALRIRYASRVQPHLFDDGARPNEYSVDGLLALVTYGSRIGGSYEADWIRVLVPDESYRHLAFWQDLLDESLGSGDGGNTLPPEPSAPEIPPAPIRIKTVAKRIGS